MREDAPERRLDHAMSRAEKAWAANESFHASELDEGAGLADAVRKPRRTARARASTTRLLTPSGLSKLLQVSEDWIVRAVEARRIPHLRLGEEIRFDRRKIDVWLAGHEIDVEEQTDGSDDVAATEAPAGDERAPVSRGGS